ncbi:MAG: hypothetical protein GY877_13400 [Hyphomicrobium sp.]|nr:hypothetical protein [Hyphomicrobium sp.]
MKRVVVRDERKYDLFSSDYRCLQGELTASYREIPRECTSTLTLYFYDPKKGPPDVLTDFRLRTYGNLSQNGLSFDDLAALHWHVEIKSPNTKEVIEDNYCLRPAPVTTEDGQELYILYKPYLANLIKVSRRQHFALHSTDDESHRLTADSARELYKVTGRDLTFLGDMGPRIEIKHPTGETEDNWPMVRDIEGSSFWAPFGALEFYMQHLLHKYVKPETYLAFPEIEVKHQFSGAAPEGVFGGIFDWLSEPTDRWQLLLPFPHAFSRTRRYHVCAGSDPDTHYTVVETRSGLCSLKTKKAAGEINDVLLRDTQAMHTTDTSGEKTSPDTFIRDRGLTKLNAFRKTQLKIPIALRDGAVFQFTVDHCVDENGHILDQVEIEYGGSLNEQPSAEKIFAAMHDLSTEMENSVEVGSLVSTNVSKYDFFRPAQ